MPPIESESSGNTSVVTQQEKMELVTHSWSAPLPAPDDFNAYPESVQAEIVNEMKKENEHRRNLQTKQLNASISGLNADIAQNNRAQYYTLFFMLTVVLMAFVLVIYTEDFRGLLLILVIIPFMTHIINLVHKMFRPQHQTRNDEQKDQS